MDIKELIAKYNIKATENGKLQVSRTNLTGAVMEEIKDKKSEIIAFLNQEEAKARAEAEDRERKEASIDGLSELKAAISAEHQYRTNFNKMMDSEANDGTFPPKAPKSDVDALRQKYPRASAFLLAQDWSNASHYAKVSAGKKAVEKILNGEDFTAVISDMKKTFDNYCETNMWN